MKKLLLAALTISILATFSFAQSFELYHEEELFQSGGIVVVPDDVSASLMLAHMSIKNISAVSKVVKAKKEEISVVPGSVNTFCWFLCWEPTIFVSPFGVTIEPGITNNEFSGDYMPLNNAGVTIMRYTFFDEANPNDSIHFYTHFNAGTIGMDELTNENVSFSNPYPNPARSQVSFDYTLPLSVNTASLKIHNLLGSIVKEQRISDRSGKITIDVSDLNEGFYFYSVQANNEILETKRLVISR